MNQDQKTPPAPAKVPDPITCGDCKHAQLASYKDPCRPCIIQATADKPFPLWESSGTRHPTVQIKGLSMTVPLAHEPEPSCPWDGWTPCNDLPTEYD